MLMNNAIMIDITDDSVEINSDFGSISGEILYTNSIDDIQAFFNFALLDNECFILYIWSNTESEWIDVLDFNNQNFTYKDYKSREIIKWLGDNISTVIQLSQ